MSIRLEKQPNSLLEFLGMYKTKQKGKYTAQCKPTKSRNNQKKSFFTIFFYFYFFYFFHLFYCQSQVFDCVVGNCVELIDYLTYN